MIYVNNLSNISIGDSISPTEKDSSTAHKIDEALVNLESNSAIAYFLNLPKQNVNVVISVSNFRIYNPDKNLSVEKEGFLSHVLQDGDIAYYHGTSEQAYSGPLSLIAVPSSSVNAFADRTHGSINGFDGQSKFASLERVLFHEISHRVFGIKHNLYSFLTYHPEDGQRQEAHVSYQENLAIMAENFLYVPYARSSTSQIDDDYRLGHTPNTGSSPGKSGGVSGMDAFDAFNQNRTIDPSKTGEVSFRASNASGDISLTMTAYDPGVRVKLSPTTNIIYDHYIRYVMDSTASVNHHVFSAPSSPSGLSAMAEDVLRSSIVQPDQSPVHAIDTVNMTRAAVSSLINPRTNALFNKIGLTDVLSETGKAIDRMISLSAERFVFQSSIHENDEYREVTNHDLIGPYTKTPYVMGKDTDGTDIGRASLVHPQTLAIDDTGSLSGAVIFGASGYKERIENGALVSAGVDLGSSVDRILGSAHNDILISGTGYRIGKSNELYGNDGSDVLLGRTGNDDLYGGSGNDVLNGGDGYNRLDGGDGFDIASYVGETGRMTIDLRGSGYARMDYDPSGRTRYDNLTNIEAAVGGDGGNTFHGNGQSLMIGGSGDDTFYLKSGDIAYGGGGNDTFIMTEAMDYGASDSSVKRYAILDLSEQDILFSPYDFTSSYYVGYVGTMPNQSITRFNTTTTRIDDPSASMGRISIYFNGYSDENKTSIPDVHKLRYEIFTPNAGMSLLDGGMNYLGTRGGTYDVSRIFDRTPPIRGTASDERVNPGHKDAIYDSGGGADVAAYDDGTHAPVTVSVSSDGVDTSYIVDGFSNSYQHDIRGFAGIVGTSGSDQFNVESVGGTRNHLDGGAGSDTLSMMQSTGRTTLDLDAAILSTGSGSLSFDGIERIQLGNEGSTVHADLARSDSIYLYTGLGDHVIDVVNGIHVRTYSPSTNVTLNVKQAYDPDFDPYTASHPRHESTIFNSTLASTHGGSMNMHLVFDETYTGDVGTSRFYGFNVIGSIIFTSIYDMMFESDTINLNMSGLDQNFGYYKVYGSHVSSTIQGSAIRDIIHGRGSAGDVIHGGAGGDEIIGSNAGSHLYGDGGDDFIYGGSGDDHLYSGTGFDRLYGGKGDDTFHVGPGDAMVMGGMGYATDGGWGTDTVMFDFGFEEVVSISTREVFDYYNPENHMLSTTVQMADRTLTLYDCDFMSFAGMNAMAIVSGFEYHI